MYSLTKERYMKVRICFTLVIGILGFVGSMDYNDAVAQQSYNCKMVEEGHWPKSMCKEG
jgi:hypothetical protein